MKNPKGLIVTIIIIAAPLIWFAFRMNAIDQKLGMSGDKIANAENQINEVINEEVNNATNNETTSGNTVDNTSGDTPSSIYGDPISKLIENAKIKVDTANIYVEPDENSAIVIAAKKDTIVTVQEYANGWSNIKVGESTGWIKSDLVAKPGEENENSLKSAVGHSATILVDTLNVRSKAEGDVIDQINKGDKVNIIGANDNESWYEIQYGTKSGWITSNKEYVQVNY